MIINQTIRSKINVLRLQAEQFTWVELMVLLPFQELQEIQVSNNRKKNQRIKQFVLSLRSFNLLDKKQSLSLWLVMVFGKFARLKVKMLLSSSTKKCPKTNKSLQVKFCRIFWKKHVQKTRKVKKLEKTTYQPF